MEKDVLRLGHAASIDIDTGGHEEAHGFLELLSGLFGPFREVHLGTGFLDIAADEPGSGSNAAIPWPLGVVGVAVAARAVNEFGNLGMNVELRFHCERRIDGWIGTWIKRKELDSEEENGHRSSQVFEAPHAAV